MQKSLIKFLIFTIYCAGIFLPTNLISQEMVQRNVLLEMFTGTWCGWCPYGAEVLKEIKDNHNNVVALVYHINDEMETESGKKLNERLGAAFPQATIDRIRYQGENKIPLGRGSWKKRIIEQSEVPSPISIELEGSFKPDTRKMNVMAVFCSYEDIYAELRVNVVVIEDSLNFKQKIYDKPYKEIDPYYHMHVVRDMVTGTLGEQLNETPLKKQVCIRKDYNFTLKEDIDPVNSHIVVFVHENESRGFGGVQQAAIISVTGANR